MFYRQQEHKGESSHTTFPRFPFFHSRALADAAVTMKGVFMHYKGVFYGVSGGESVCMCVCVCDATWCVCACMHASMCASVCMCMIMWGAYVCVHVHECGHVRVCVCTSRTRVCCLLISLLGPPESLEQR